MTIPDCPRVIIIGAGFAGLWAARSLSHSQTDVLVLDRNNYHTFFSLLYQVAAAELEPEEIVYPVRSLLFVGQGIVPETLNLSQLPGYSTGGSLHIIANNQLGFTAIDKEARSSLHASALAKGFEILVIHVNADEPKACIEAVCTAFAYRQRFHKLPMIKLHAKRFL